MIITVIITAFIAVIFTVITMTSPQLLVIVSDGRGIFHEGRERVTQAVMKARQVIVRVNVDIFMIRMVIIITIIFRLATSASS